MGVCSPGEGERPQHRGRGPGLDLSRRLRPAGSARGRGGRWPGWRFGSALTMFYFREAESVSGRSGRRGRHLPPVCGGFRRRSVTDSEGHFLHPLAEGGFISWDQGVQNEPRPWVGE